MLLEHAKVLTEQYLPPDVEELFMKCKSLIDMSRSRMSSFYEQWDFNDNITKNRRLDDSQDIRASERKEPRKMVVPLTSSQVDTFVSFAYMVLTQREFIYELEGAGMEDVNSAKVAQALLERDLKHSNFRGDVLLQALQNAAKFNLGVIKHAWTRESYFEEVEQQIDMIGADPSMMAPGVQTVEQEFVTFLGNKVSSVSPYRFFPDPRFPLCKFQDGEFCGSEDEYSRSRLNQLQAQGQVAGVEHASPMTVDFSIERRLSFRDAKGNDADMRQYLEDNVIITEVQIELVPAETMFGGKPLGPETEAVKYVVWYANDNRIVRIAELAYGHCNFLYRVLQYSLDETEYVGPALPDLIEKMQEAVSWFINSRITSVRKVIDNKLIVDPRGIDIKALKNRDPILLLKPNAQGGDVRRFVQQLNVTDVTAGHLQDVSVLSGLARETTGLSENLLGQYMSGRRSATESRSVNANASARVKKIVDSMWYSALEPLGQDMLANHRSYLDAPQLIKVMGRFNVLFDTNVQQGIAEFLNVTREDIKGNFDFTIYDGTLPSEKQQNAAGLQDLLGIIMPNPQLAMMLGYAPEVIHEILMTILESRGVKHARRFRLQAQQLAGSGLGQPQGAPIPGAATPGQPGLPVPGQGIGAGMP